MKEPHWQKQDEKTVKRAEEERLKAEDLKKMLKKLRAVAQTVAQAEIHFGFACSQRFPHNHHR